MNKNIVYAGLAITVLGLFAWKYVSLNFFGPSDERMIQIALNDALESSREGRPGGVLEVLSSQFMVNTEQPGSRQIANIIRNNHPEITILDRSPLISGDKARITSPIDVKLAFMGMRYDQKVDNVSLIFERTLAHEWVFVPVKKWRLSQVLVPDNLTPRSFDP